MLSSRWSRCFPHDELLDVALATVAADARDEPTKRATRKAAYICAMHARRDQLAGYVTRDWSEVRIVARVRDTAADLDQFAANFMRGLQQASATAGGSIDDNE